MVRLSQTPVLGETQIYCCVCGVLIEPTAITRALYRELRASGRHRHNCFSYPSRVIEDRCFNKQDPWSWISLYRLIIMDYESPDGEQCQYRLSGISHFNDSLEDVFFAVPRDRHSAFFRLDMTKPRKGPIEHIFFAEDIQGTSYYKGDICGRQPRRFGYPVHARCWSLVERLVGPEVNIHLQTFIEALRGRFQMCSCLSSEPYGYRVEEEYGFWISYPTRDNWFCRRTRFLYRDPVRVQEIKDLLKRSSKKGRHQKSALAKGKNRRAETIKQCHTHSQTRYQTRYWFACRLSSVGAESLRVRLAKLPLDILYLILDQLWYSEIQNFCAALPSYTEWCIPDQYWFRRVCRLLICEVADNFSDNKSNGLDTGFDWEYLCCEIEKLMPKSDALRNRRRIMTVLQEIKQLFFKMISKSCPGRDLLPIYEYNRTACDKTWPDENRFQAKIESI